MTAERPVNLSLLGLFAAMPVTAVASILHRITGIVLFVGALYLCYLLDLALSDQTGFAQAGIVLATPSGKLALWAILAALAYHLLAGVKHLLLDLHVGDTLVGARFASWVSIVLAVSAAVAAAFWLW